MYRPPNDTSQSHKNFLETTTCILQKLSTYNASQKIIASDLNFGNCYCKSPILEPKPLDSAGSDLFSSFGFTQLIDIPTRITENTTSLIDLFFEMNIDTVSIHGTLPKISDHDGVVVSYAINTETPKIKTKTLYDYKNADLIGLQDYFKKFDFESTVFTHHTIKQAELYTKV